MESFVAIIKSLRPRQWVKNMFVFAALIFAAEFTNFRSVIITICAFALFSFVASSMYLINDVCDYEIDRRHPKKKFRPIASDQVSRQIAIFLSVVLGISSLLISLIISPKLTLILAIYVVNNLLYSLKLKHVVILDILMVASGFVLRAVGGALAIDVPISSWFIIIIFLLTLFLAIVKRRQEFLVIEKIGGKKRKVLDNYSVEMLDQMSNIVLPAVLVSYIFYTFNKFPGQYEYFIFTVPFVIYGIFRYLYLIHKKGKGESPTEAFLTDVPLLLTVVLWAGVCAYLLYQFG